MQACSRGVEDPIPGKGLGAAIPEPHFQIRTLDLSLATQHRSPLIDPVAAATAVNDSSECSLQLPSGNLTDDQISKI